MRSLIIVLSLFVASFQLSAQTTLVDNLKSASDMYTKALVEANVDYILSTVHPNILEMGGGEEFVRKDVISDIEMFKNAGVEYASGTASDPSESYHVGDETFYLVPIDWRASIGSNNYQSQQYLLASTQDEGDSWSFINISKYSAKNLAVYINGFDESVEFPLPGPLEQID